MVQPKQTVSFILLIVFSALVALGSGGSGNSPVNSTAQASGSTKGMVELGPVKGASVVVRTIDGYDLYNTTTDDSGNFTINIDELKSVIANSGIQADFVKVVSTGGIDTDPNDDGEINVNEQIEVKGKVSGIIPLTTIYESNGYRINFISTALSELLQDKENITDEELAYVAERLGVPDINEDGEVSIDDLVDYNISQHDSDIETLLRNGLLEFIHNGDTESKQLFVDDLRNDTGFVKPQITKSGQFYEVSLDASKSEYSVYYGISVNENRPSFNLYNGEKISINPNDAFFFQECSDHYGCYRLQKIFFYEDKYYVDYDAETPVKTADFDTLIHNLEEKRDILDSINQNISDLNAEIDEINSNIFDM